MLELMSDARRAEIKARFEAATPGPWAVDDRVLHVYQNVPHGERIANAEIGQRKNDQKVADAQFIAHARTDLPELYAENERLRAELARVTQAKQGGRMIEIPEFPQDMDDILEPLKVQSALNSEVMKLNFRKEHEPKDVSILDYTIIAALYKALTDAEIAQRKEQNDG